MDQAAARIETERQPPATVRIGPPVGPDPAIVDPAEHNVVFTSLVTGDGDIVGLVAYSIYKQNKYDWLDAYSRLEGRMPEPAEVHSYLLGESTARRLATYRHLAQAVLDGRGPDVPGAPAGALPAVPARRAEPARAPQDPPPRIGIARGRSNFQLSSRAIVALCVTLVVLLALLWLMRSGAPLPPQTPGK
ncbi:hypothetical protein [Lichenibacterium dinghuense]|uniref:hypothetical protein n=1 Tax=Lichenibacterium dinghuense TaxID=2895977 RepID=UPI001F320C05|nr:hypothetical protein [Lichenibacterium sp. 6Y81]